MTLDHVSQSLNDRCSSIARTWAQTTRPSAASSTVARDDFSHTIITPSGPIAITSDGIGTKVEIAERMARYDTLGFDLVAMVVDDLIAGGARPLALSNILDVDRFDEVIVDKLMKGLAAAARLAGVVVSGGEIAQLSRRITGYGDGMHVNWCATALGVPFERRADANRPVSPGDCIVALASDGFRSNGFTLARSLLEAAFGHAWHSKSIDPETTWGDCLLTPSRIYSPAMTAAIDAGIPILASSHVTGGGIPGNLPRILNGANLCAKLDTLWPPHPAMCQLAKMADLAPEEIYGQWNMGTGFFCVVPHHAAEALIAILAASGIRARIAGTFIDGAGIRIDARLWGMGEISFEGEG